MDNVAFTMQSMPRMRRNLRIVKLFFDLSYRKRTCTYLALRRFRSLGVFLRKSRLENHAETEPAVAGQESQREEQQRFEKGMCHQVEQSGGVGRRAEGGAETRGDPGLDADLAALKIWLANEEANAEAAANSEDIRQPIVRLVEVAATAESAAERDRLVDTISRRVT